MVPTVHSSRGRLTKSHALLVVVRESTTSDSEEASGSHPEDEDDSTEQITAKRANEIEKALEKCRNDFESLRERVRNMETVLKKKKEARDRARNKLGTLQVLKLAVQGFMDKHGDRTDDLDTELEGEYEKLREAIDEEMDKGYCGGEEENDEELPDDARQVPKPVDSPRGKRRRDDGGPEAGEVDGPKKRRKVAVV